MNLPGVDFEKRSSGKYVITCALLFQSIFVHYDVVREHNILDGSTASTLMPHATYAYIENFEKAPRQKIVVYWRNDNVQFMAFKPYHAIVKGLFSVFKRHANQPGSADMKV